MAEVGTVAELHVGAEHDKGARQRLKNALRRAGAKRVSSGWRLFGSQEISDATFSIGDARLRVQSETYIGITVSGDDEAVAALAAYL